MWSGGIGRTVAVVAAVGACATACSSAGSSPAAGAPPAQAASNATRPAAQARQLHVDFTEQPSRWRTVATFTYGKRADQLGPPGGSAGFSGPHGAAGGALALPPAAIAYASDSIWVLDQMKHRVAHFSLDGRYLGQVTGLSPTASDLAIAPADEFVVIDDEPRAKVRTFAPTSGRASRAVGVTNAPGNLSRLVPTDTGFAAWFSPLEPSSPRDPADGLHPLRLDPPALKLTTPGAPEDDDLLSASISDDHVLHVQLAPEWERTLTLTSRHKIGVGIQSMQISGGYTYLWLYVAESRIHGTGGQFLLVLDGTGNVRSFEQIATPPGGYDSEVTRPFAATSNGDVYQWFTTPTHAELRLRP
ncbi:MAG TPA: hypothetical protein VHD58_03790 [Mycobacteriales bacterium]|nr:hypothetical protein [Mycobacteriales bacterium]